MISRNFPTQAAGKGANQHFATFQGEITTNCQEQSEEFEVRMNIPQSKIAYYFVNY